MNKFKVGHRVKLKPHDEKFMDIFITKDIYKDLVLNKDLRVLNISNGLFSNGRVEICYILQDIKGYVWHITLDLVLDYEVKCNKPAWF